jgi:PAS domain S-box-containing protein
MPKREPEAISRLPEAIFLATALFIALLIAVLSYRNAQQAAEARAQLQISQAVGSFSADLMSALKDAETGQRGFLLTGEEQYLEPYHHALSDAPGMLRPVESLLAIEPDQAARLKAVQPLIASKLTELKDTIDLRRRDRSAEALAIVRQGRGKALMDEIRQRLGAITASAQDRSAQLSRAAEQSARDLRFVSSGGSVLMFGFLVVLAIAVSRGTQRREELYRRAQAGEKLWATTIASIADAVIVTDASGNITFINSIALQLNGWTEKDAIGTPIANALVLVNEVTREKVENPVHHAIQTGAAVGLANHTTLLANTGAEISIDDSAAPIRNEQGVIVGAVLVFRDITARRRSDRELAESADALRRANEELQQFAYIASHDLRAPLNSMNTMADLLAQRFPDQLGSPGRELVDFITDSGRRMSRLIDDILAFANASQSNLSAPLPVSLDQALKRALANLESEIQESGARISSDSLPSVLAHETPVLQMFQNLIGNALKYRTDKPPQVLISAVLGGPECTVSVRDNGIGIEPEYIEEIFKPFKRLHGPNYPGSGIGLASCRKIAAAYGGRIWVESEPGKGSTFFFSLPLG